MILSFLTLVYFRNCQIESKQQCLLSIYEGRLFVCFNCFVCTNDVHQTQMLQIMFLVSLESSRGGGCMGWLHDVWSPKVLEY